MESVVGIFGSRSPAEAAVQELLLSGISRDSIIFLTGESGEEKIEDLPTTNAERPGPGKAIGAVVGGAAGTGAGLALGSAVASLIVPGVGTIMAIGLGAAAWLGLGGAAAGAMVAENAENALDTGVPRDDVYLYRELLKRGRTLVIANTRPDSEAKRAREIFERLGTESVEAARRQLKGVA